MILIISNLNDEIEKLRTFDPTNNNIVKFESQLQKYMKFLQTRGNKRAQLSDDKVFDLLVKIPDHPAIKALTESNKLLQKIKEDVMKIVMTDVIPTYKGLESQLNATGFGINVDSIISLQDAAFEELLSQPFSIEIGTSKKGLEVILNEGEKEFARTIYFNIKKQAEKAKILILGNEEKTFIDSNTGSEIKYKDLPGILDILKNINNIQYKIETLGQFSSKYTAEYKLGEEEQLEFKREYNAKKVKDLISAIQKEFDTLYGETRTEQNIKGGFLPETIKWVPLLNEKKTELERIFKLNVTRINNLNGISEDTETTDLKTIIDSIDMNQLLSGYLDGTITQEVFSQTIINVFTEITRISSSVRSKFMGGTYTNNTTKDKFTSVSQLQQKFAGKLVELFGIFNGKLTEVSEVVDSNYIQFEKIVNLKPILEQIKTELAKENILTIGDEK